ncbi:MAG TPA: hypothetical protein VLT87_11185 [Thermoanaerobaculia bacterium]|nr:hypothetical protein [Thermoanaerobaculia bacterium]
MTDLSLLGALDLPYLIRPGEIRRGAKGFEAEALPYLDRATVEAQLDRAASPTGWQVGFSAFAEDGSVYCNLGIRVENEWAWRGDVGYPEGEDRPAASAATNAFKRAGARWGIGRFLHEYPRVFLPCRVTMAKVEERKVPSFSKWECNPVEELESRVAARRGTVGRLYAAMREHGVTENEVARWAISKGVRDLRSLSASEKGELESLINSGRLREVLNVNA